MATYAQRALQIIEGIIDATPTAAQQQRVAAAYEAYAPDIVSAIKAARPLVDDGQGNMIPDASPLTGAEKAEVFVKATRRWGRSVLRAVAETGATQQNQVNVKAAGDTAEGDL